MGCTISFESQNQAESRDGSGAVVHASQREKEGKTYTGRFSTASRNFGWRREGVKRIGTYTEKITIVHHLPVFGWESGLNDSLDFGWQKPALQHLKAVCYKSG